MTTAIPSSSTISSPLTSAHKVLPLPATPLPEPPSPAPMSASMREETVTIPSTLPLEPTSTTTPSGTLQTGTTSSQVTSASSTQSLTSATSQPEFVNSSSAPAVTSAQGNEESSIHIVHSITVVTATSTSTLTPFPESTFSTPVVVTTVQDGTTFIGAPPLVTLFSSSTDSDGLSVTSTHVYANPPTVATVRTKSFFHNTGAMAGIFTLAGVIAAFFLIGMLYLIRRLYRTRRRDKKFVGRRTLAPELDPDHRHPFNDNDPHEPAMHSLSYGISVGVSGSAHPAHNASPSYKMGFFDVHGHSTSTDQLRSVQQMNASGTELAQMTPQSTPSIYPATLPLNESEDEAAIDQQPVEQNRIFLQTEMGGLTERSTERNSVISPVVLRETYTADVPPPPLPRPPPRPPKSVLRTGSVRIDNQWAKSWTSASSVSGSHPTT